MHVTIRRNKMQNTYCAINDYGECMGVGMTHETALNDAVSNIQRKPIPPLPPTGSATWSLKSDEVYWKGRRNDAQ